MDTVYQLSCPWVLVIIVTFLKKGNPITRNNALFFMKKACSRSILMFLLVVGINVSKKNQVVGVEKI